MSTAIKIAPAEQALFADYSYISQFAECARRGYYRYERHLTGLEPGVPLHAGRAIHAGLDELYRDWDIESAVAAMHADWGTFKTPPVGKFSYLTAGHCEIVLRNFADDRKDDSITPLRLSLDEMRMENLAHAEMVLDENGFVRLAETPLAVRWIEGSTLINYAGKLDLPAVSGDSLYIVDHKCTTQWVTEFWAARYAHSHQMRGYLAMMQLLTGKKFAGVFINGVHMGEGAADPEEKWKRRTSARSALFGPYQFSPQQIAETHEWASTHLKLIDWYREHDLWPQNDRACSFCEFKELCRAHPLAREGLIKSNFRVNPPSGILASGADSDD